MSPETKTDEQAELQTTRSWPLEITGLLSILCFFIGIAWAWQTQVGALITASQFEQLEMGQTLAEVEEIFGQSGTAVPNTDDPSSGAEYVWENSSDSKATCVFADGKLVKKSAKNLP